MRNKRFKTGNISDAAVVFCYAQYAMQVEQGVIGVWPYDHLMELTGAPFKVCYAAMERACERGYVEYGVSLRSGWLTIKGRSLLAEAAEHALAAKAAKLSEVAP